ncbi:MAG TPA: hypothetical protein VHY37_12240 [Tepidisphaeraceae bacterium]|jgi:hypothetical protein|nr:hypothetical protein [Tepidisphaeraceae bacterium]
MTAAAIPTNLADSPHGAERPPNVNRTLRRLFLMLFLRGRSARGLRRKTVPRSMAKKLFGTLSAYFVFGMLSLSFIRQPIFALAIYLHALTFVFLAMMIASSVGEILFNKDEADILLHRPIRPRALLWAKIRVLLESSLWLAVAFNFVGLIVGTRASDGGWLFIPIHLFSILLEAIFAAGCVVAVYQLCLRHMGRERLESVLTITQVAVSIAAALSGTIVPQLVFQITSHGPTLRHSPWLAVLPPAWFAGIDDCLSGSMRRGSLGLATIAVIATACISWIAFVKLGAYYEQGMQRLGETVAPSGSRARRRWLNALLDRPPMRWWLSDPKARAAFLLSAAYLSRDRDTKLRIFPSIAPIMVLPALFLFQQNSGHPEQAIFAVAMVGNWISMLPFVGLNLLQYSQQWQASDVFRAAPLPGPGALCQGAQRAMLLFVTAPMLLASVGLVWLAGHDLRRLLLLAPGVIALPVFTAMASFIGGAVPLSRPTEEASRANRGMIMVVFMVISTALAGVVALAWNFGLFRWLIVAESLGCAAAYIGCRVALGRMRWWNEE